MSKMFEGRYPLGLKKVVPKSCRLLHKNSNATDRTSQDYWTCDQTGPWRPLKTIQVLAISLGCPGKHEGKILPPKSPQTLVAIYRGLKLELVQKCSSSCVAL